MPHLHLQVFIRPGSQPRPAKAPRNGLEHLSCEPFYSWILAKATSLSKPRQIILLALLDDLEFWIKFPRGLRVLDRSLLAEKARDRNVASQCTDEN
jgi:hypothetical protein